jgi:hypothetical protein
MVLIFLLVKKALENQLLIKTPVTESAPLTAVRKASLMGIPRLKQNINMPSTNQKHVSGSCF